MKMKLTTLAVLTPLMIAACSSTITPPPLTAGQVDTDRDGFADSIDAFPFDRNAAIDRDADGRPDVWLNGASKSAEKSSRRLDKEITFPGGEDTLELRRAAIEAEISKLKSGNIKPEFTMAALIERIDLDKPGLEKVKAAANDPAAATDALIEYYKTKFKKPKNRLKGRSLSKKEQDNFFHHHHGDKSIEVIFMGNGYDWATDPSDRGEWMAVHNRQMGDIMEMYSAYQKTGNQLFYKELIARIVSYYDHAYPFTEKEGKYAYGVNHPFSNTFRVNWLVELTQALVHDKHMDNQTFAYMMNSLYLTVDTVTKNYSRSGNHLTYELERVLSTGIKFNEFKDASAKETGWVEATVKTTSELLAREVFPDGMNKELSPHYHGDYSFKFSKYVKIADENGFGDSYNQAFRDLLKSTFDAAQVFQLPGFRRVSFGDAWPRDNDKKHFDTMKNVDQKHKYLATLGKEGEAFRNNKLDWGGYYALRSDWGFNPTDKGIGMVIKNGYEAEWHNQPDNLSFEMAAYGRTLVADASQQVYFSKNPDVKAMRAKYVQTRAHNTVTLDNKTSKFGAVPHRWAEDITINGVNLDLVELSNQSYDNLKHTRTVLFIDKSYYVLVDKLEGDAKTGTLRAHFQLANENQMAKKQAFNADHSKLDSDNLRLFTTMPEVGNRKGNLVVQAWEQKGLELVSEMEGIGPYAKGAGFGVNYLNGSEFERRAVAYELPKTASTQYFVTALVPFKGDNSDGKQTPEVKVDFNPAGGEVSLTVNGKAYQVTLPSGNQYALDTDGDGINNLADKKPFGEQGILNPYKS